MWISRIIVSVVLVLWTRDIIGANAQEPRQDFKLPTQLKVNNTIIINGQKSPSALLISVNLMTNTSTVACTNQLRYKSPNDTDSEDDSTHWASSTFIGDVFQVIFRVAENSIENFHGSSAVDYCSIDSTTTLQSIESLSIIGAVEYIDVLAFTLK